MTHHKGVGSAADGKKLAQREARERGGPPRRRVGGRGEGGGVACLGGRSRPPCGRRRAGSTLWCGRRAGASSLPTTPSTQCDSRNPDLGVVLNPVRNPQPRTWRRPRPSAVPASQASASHFKGQDRGGATIHTRPPAVRSHPWVGRAERGARRARVPLGQVRPTGRPPSRRRPPARRRRSPTSVRGRDAWPITFRADVGCVCLHNQPTLARNDIRLDSFVHR